MRAEWSPTTILAIYGSILSTITFGWNLFRDIRDQGKLKLSASVRRLVRGENGAVFSVRHDYTGDGASDQLFIVMTVANVGRRPMRWEGWGGSYKNPHNGKNAFVCIPRHLPKMLAEKETHREHTLLDDDFDPDNIKTIYMWDGADGEWKLSWWQLRKLVQEAKEARTPHSMSE